MRSCQGFRGAGAALLLAAALLLFSTGSFAGDTSESGCRVLDPELQGRYSGGCRDGLAEGKGVARGTARYEGEFHAGRKHGRGVMAWPTGDRYEGEFVEDRKEGRGSYTWGSGTPWAGERYTGEYRADQRHGPGVYSWPDGERYSGAWKHDKPTGPPHPRMLARMHEERVRVAAVARAGQGVCRRMPVGSVVHDWIRGVVTVVDGENISVRIEDAGQYEHRVGGVVVAKGVVLRDEAVMWTACLPKAGERKTGEQ